MSYTSTVEFRRWAGNEDGLKWHLTHNHYPPVDLAFLPAAKEAIQLANDECWDDEVTLANGRVLTAIEVVRQLHLDAFLGDDPARECDLDVDESDEAPEGEPIIG